MITYDAMKVFKATGTCLEYHGETELRPKPVLTLEDGIIEAVCDLYGVTREELEGPSRKRKFAWPRQVAISLIYARLPYSAAGVGSIFGGRHYSYVYWSREKVNRRMMACGDTANEVKLVLCEGLARTRKEER